MQRQSAGSTCSMRGEGDLVAFCREVVKISKPMVVVGNKVDMAPPDLLARLRNENMLFSSAASELALRNAANSHIIRYVPGDPVFSVTDENHAQCSAEIRSRNDCESTGQFWGTGVQQAVNHAVFSLLDRIVVYPVEDEHHFCDGKGASSPMHSS